MYRLFGGYVPFLPPVLRQSRAEHVIPNQVRQIVWGIKNALAVFSILHSEDQASFFHTEVVDSFQGDHVWYIRIQANQNGVGGELQVSIVPKDSFFPPSSLDTLSLIHISEPTRLRRIS